LNTQESRNEVSNSLREIGRCQGCLKMAVLEAFACSACRDRFGKLSGVLFERIRSDSEFASAFWSALTPKKRANFVSIFGDPCAAIIKEESEKLVRREQNCAGEPWTPEPAYQELEVHICRVLLRRQSSPEDLVRAAGMLRGVWRELTPERWRVLLRSIERHSRPEFLELVPRCVPDGPVKSLDREEVLADIIGALERARASRMPGRGGALLQLALRLGEASQMKSDHLSWGIRNAPEAASCLAEWAVTHATQASFTELAEATASSVRDRCPTRRCLAWTALWLQPTPARWHRYAEQCTSTSEQSEARSSAGLMNERLAAWSALIVRCLPDGPARIVVEQREGARQALNRALRLESDAFVRAVLELWVARDSSGSWRDTGCADDGI